jgi:hypothetical protein
MTGFEYLLKIRDNQDRCEAETDDKLPDIAPAMLTLLSFSGDTLLLLEQFGTCRWGCKGGNHLIERFTARAVSYCLASIRLLWFGHYDEAYALLRNLGELANLLFLFSNDADQLKLWEGASDSVRRNDFGAGSVRKKLADRKLPLVLNQERFKMLSACFAHSGEVPVSQLHNPVGLVTMGGHIQPGGLSYGVLQLAVFLATIAFSISSLGNMSDEHRNLIRKAADNLMPGSQDDVTRETN